MQRYKVDRESLSVLEMSMPSALSQPEAYAANVLGLSDQVPAKVVFLTDGASRRVQLGRREIVLQRTTPRNMATAGRISVTVIQVLRHLGQRHTSARW